MAASPHILTLDLGTSACKGVPDSRYNQLYDALRPMFAEPPYAPK